MKPIIPKRTKFDIVQKSPKFMLEIMTLMSSTNIVSSDKKFVLMGRSLIYILNNKHHRIDCWETPCSNILQSDK
jgi:hypothetical protein